MTRTLLHIGSQRTVLDVGAAGGPPALQRMVLPIGSSIIAERYFRHDPPTPGEIVRGPAASKLRGRRCAGHGSTQTMHGWPHSLADAV